jgi:chorismate synthase
MPIRFLTAGESHGKGLVAIIEGVPAGLSLSLSTFQKELARRKKGVGRSARQKIEDDQVEIISGVRNGQTMGSPIALMIPNKDTKERPPLHVPRPGHADLIGGIKYKHADLRNVLERASARETAIRVAVGTIARTFLDNFDINIVSHVTSIGEVHITETPDIPVEKISQIADESPERCLIPETANHMVKAIDAAKSAGDTLGGTFEVIAVGLPIGLGSYTQWDRRLEGTIAQAFLSLNAIKGVEIGMGFLSAKLKGSYYHDGLFPDKNHFFYSKTNHEGGISGGMTTGAPLIVRAAMKPIPTLMKPKDSFNIRTREPHKAHVERADTCAVSAASIISESLLALTLMDAILEKFGGDSMSEIQKRVTLWKKESNEAPFA